MRVTLAVCALSTLFTACASSGTAGAGAPVSVYLAPSAVPCEFAVMQRVSGYVTVTSTQEYVRERNRVLGQGGARIGADAVLIPGSQREPDRDNVGLQFRALGGVRQPGDFPVSGDAIRFVSTSCGAR